MRKFAIKKIERRKIKTTLKHIDYIATKMSCASGALYKLCPHIPRRALMPVYCSVEYSHLQHGIILWGNTTEAISTKLQTKKLHLFNIN